MAVASDAVLICLRTYRFLLKSSAAKVVPLDQAELNISFSCVTTLIRGLELFHHSAAPSDHLIRIAGGTYRLLPYALEYWTEHCLQYAANNDSREPGSLLLGRLNELRMNHNKFLEISRSGEVATPQSLISSKEYPSDDRLKYMSHLPIKHLMGEVLRVRWLAGQQLCENGEGKLILIWYQFCRLPCYIRR
jgi:hypothetical protein